MWRHTDGGKKNLVNCAVLTVNNAGLRTVLSSCLSHRELPSSLRESHSFLSLPADTTMASSQGIQPSKMNKREATLAFIEAYRTLPEIWDTENRHSFRINITADVASKHQRTALFLSTTVTRTRRHTELTTKNWNPWWETCAVPENIQFSCSCSFFYTVKLHSLT